ncbi:hypothetical protein [Flavihumibacter profundi]|jgi:hypothetical protein|uniref:hypothetical protein n=1 Tax=Flavihumibacter profundi TaxID=2716883 RepID=UPI001CC630B3|nr:hypothetical protein [Flavihumibacter profundi]MBZ5857620.1 hypothetical protein [Flavihumibacter profundi]
MEKELDNILERFPQYREKIILLYNNNEDFKSLSDDYLQCKNTLSKLRQHLIVADTRMENEYKALCLDLEQEILQYLNLIWKI